MNQNVCADGFSVMKTDKLFEAGNTIAWTYLSSFAYPWEALAGIGKFILSIGASLEAQGYERRGENVWIHHSAVVAPSAYIGEGVIIGPETEVRHCAFIRGNAVVGKGAVVGNSTELKNVILFDKVQVPHYNYVGDSILGYGSHMGAGSITSNVKGDKSPVSVSCEDSRFETGLKKFGAILGDHVEVGCGSILNPGCVIGKNAQLYPLSFVRGFVAENSIYKKQGDVVQRK